VDEVVPTELRTPLAVARWLMDPASVASVRKDGTELAPAAGEDTSDSQKTESSSEVSAFSPLTRT
jgi:hypothetical protein